MRIHATGAFLAVAALSPANAQRSLATWHILPGGALTIGEEGDPNTEFTRVFGVMRTSNGLILVPDFGTAEVRVFSREGAFVRKFGRRGAGPGEFRYLVPVGRNGDSMFIGDVSLGRVSVLHPVKGFQGQRSLAGLAAGRVEVVGALGNGSLLVHPLKSSGMGPQDHGVWRDSMDVGLVEPTEPPRIAWTRTFPGSSHLTINPRKEAKALAVGNYPFGPNIRFAVAASQILIGDTGSPELRVLDAKGANRKTIVLPIPRRRFDDVKFNVARKEAVEGLNDPVSVSQIEERYRLSHRPTYEPLYDRIIVSLDGLIWVERFRYPRSAPTEFLVLSGSGEAIATLTTPSNFTAYEVGTDYILGVERTVDGIERVKLVRYARKR